MAERSISRIVVIVFVLALLGLPLWAYNSVVDRREKVEAAWAQVESSYQRRADLIPNLQRSIERYLEHERDTFESVTAERSRDPAVQELLGALDRARADSDDALSERPPDDESALARIDRAQQRLGRLVRALMTRSGEYPELRAGDQFLRLQAQLEGTENRIDVARARYNESVRAYNSTIQRFPGHLVALSEGFVERPYFESEAGADRPVELDF